MGCQGSLLLPGEPLLQPHLHASQLCPPAHGASLWLRDLPGPTSWYNLPWSPEPAHHPVPTVCSAPADAPVPPGCTVGAPRRVGAPGSCQVTSPPATGPSRTQPAGGAGVASCCPTQSLQRRLSGSSCHSLSPAGTLCRDTCGCKQRLPHALGARALPPWPSHPPSQPELWTSLGDLPLTLCPILAQMGWGPGGWSPLWPGGLGWPPPTPSVTPAPPSQKPSAQG